MRNVSFYKSNDKVTNGNDVVAPLLLDICVNEVFMK